MKIRLWKLMMAAGWILLGTVTAEAMEISLLDNPPECSVAKLGQPCTVDNLEPENPGQSDMETSTPSERKVSIGESTSNSDPSPPTILIVRGGRSKPK